MRSIDTCNATETSYRDWGTKLFVFLDRGPLSADVLRRSILWIRVFCLIVSLVATISNAQELRTATANDARPANWCWSFVKAKSSTALRAAISTGELIPFQAPHSSRSFPAERMTHHLIEPIESQIASLLYRGVRDAAPSFLGCRFFLSPGSFPSLLQAKYAIWESTAADSRSLVDANGVSVDPLLQINYASWHLPVPLYLSSLRSSDRR